MKGINLKKSFACAKVEYIKWVCDARMIILAVLLIFIHSFAIEPLRENARLMGEPLNLFEQIGRASCRERVYRRV